MENPLVLLPEEVWDIILGMLEDSKDILNMLKACPGLEVVLKRKRCLWLFDQVVSFLFLRLTTKEFLNCRQTCKRWSRAADKFLEYHPSQIPCSAKENSWSSHPKHYYLEFQFPRISFDSPSQLNKFLEGMKDHPSGRNPFVGRSLEILPDVDNQAEAMEGDLNVRGHFWSLTLDLFRKFGEHIWFIEILPMESQNPLDFTGCVMDCLPLLPNLRWLDVSGRSLAFDPNTISEQHVYSQEIEEFLESIEDSLPTLPQLEILSMEELAQPLVNLFVTCYYPQIKSLTLELKYWRPWFSKLLPKLTELSIMEAGSKLGVSSLLMNIEAPELLKLNVLFDDGEAADPVHVTIDQDIFPWLRRFPNIRRLEWQLPTGKKGSLQEDGVLSGADAILSLKSLVIKDDIHVSYKFLLSFPNLEYLSVEEWVSVDSSIDVVDESSGVIRDCFKTMKRNGKSCSNSWIWEVLPKLKQITIDEGNDDEEEEEGEEGNRKICHFTRAAYEYGSKGKECGWRSSRIGCQRLK